MRSKQNSEITEHFAELRARLIRSAIYIAVAAAVVWLFYDRMLGLITAPMLDVLREKGSKFLLTSFPEGFMIRLQLCVVAGVIVASPLLIIETWLFVAPALTADEKKPIKWMVPLTIALFLIGVTLCYLILPVAFRWFAGYVPPDAELRPALQPSILFSLKMLLVFGIAFELPVFLMLLAKLGIVNSDMLKAHWRVSVLTISIAAAVATPSNDAFSMLIMTVPMAGLYFLSIALVRIVQKQ